MTFQGIVMIMQPLMQPQPIHNHSYNSNDNDKEQLAKYPEVNIQPPKELPHELNILLLVIRDLVETVD